MAEHILVVDDDAPIRELLRYNLVQAGYRVTTAADGPEALRLLGEPAVDLILLDLMMPYSDGLEICRTVRQQRDIPIIMLTARKEEVDRVLGLEMGADDYVTKPFSPRELVARVKAVLRRRSRGPEPHQKLAFGDLEIWPERHEVKVAGKPVDLTATEFGLLQALAQNAGKVMTREALLQKVWGYDFYGDIRTVDVHIRHLREKLEPEGGASRRVETVRGVGYRLRDER